MAQQMNFEILQQLNEIQKNIDGALYMGCLLSNLKCSDPTKVRKLEVREYYREPQLLDTPNHGKIINSEEVPAALRKRLIDIVDKYEDIWVRKLESITIEGLHILDKEEQ